MKLKYLFVILFSAANLLSFAQTSSALALSELLAHTTRFKPYDFGPLTSLKNISTQELSANLKTDNQKSAFWLNIYNSMMLSALRDTSNEGVYLNFYKLKNINIAGKLWSLYQIEHEFLRLGKKNKAAGFKKSTISKDTFWVNLRPKQFNYKVIFLMYRGMYGYPPFQVVENSDIDLAYAQSLGTYPELQAKDGSSSKLSFDWVKPYWSEIKKFLDNPSTPTEPKTIFLPTPKAVFINNFYPKYEGVKFKKEEENPWLKK
jgi:hypothetical protein